MSRRTLIVALAIVAVAVFGCFFFRVTDGGAATWRSDSGEEIRLAFHSQSLAVAVSGVLFGPGSITGTYNLRGNTGRSDETGTFTIVLGEKGYVEGYTLMTADGHQRQWKTARCASMKDERGSLWTSEGSVPIRIHQGFIG